VHGLSENDFDSGGTFARDRQSKSQDVTEDQENNSMNALALAIIVLVNGAPVRFTDAKPYVESNTLMVPLRGVFEKLGANVQYSAAADGVFIKRGATQVQVPIGKMNAYVNGQSVGLGLPARRKAGRIYVPLRFVSEALGAKVLWNNRTRTAAIDLADTSSNGTPTVPTSGNNGAGNNYHPPSIMAGKVELRAVSDKKYYKAGEPVRFTLTAINQDDRPRVLRFMTGQSFDITVTPVNQTEPLVRWDWSHDRMFTQAIREVTIEPGHTMTFNAVWKQQNNEGSEMPRGDYLVQAKLVSEEGAEAPSFQVRLVY
jgi:hypothetical protein